MFIAHRNVVAGFVASAAMLFLTACPQTTTNNPPVITTFSSNATTGTAPLAITFSWAVSDANNDALTCLLDVNNDGVAEYTIGNCQNTNTQSHTFGSVGNFVAKLTVRDGRNGETNSLVIISVSAGSQPNNVVVGTGAFNIDLRFASGFPAQYASAFIDAAARWTKVITADLPDETGLPGDLAALCGEQNFPNNGAINVDDVIIFATVTTIDGPANTLGVAGPCYYLRNTSKLPFVGRMKFDEADFARMSQNEIIETVMHEMGHVFGIGTTWDTKNLTTGAGPANTCGTDPRFIGTNAVREWQALGGTGTVPLENTGGPGTCEGHWREKTFSNELMTGWSAANGVKEPLSRVTIASLQDLGYAVDYTQAEAYSLPNPITLSVQATGTKREVILLKPRISFP